MPKLHRISQAVTQVITWAVKIVGLVAATNELLIQPRPTPLALAVSGFMVAGGELSERLILLFLDRLMGTHTAHAEPHDSDSRTGS